MSQQTIAHDLDTKSRTKDVILDETVNFESLLLPEKILKGLSQSGFRKPSPIQFKAIPLGRCGFDLIVKSKSGTGKTLVFSIIALETVNTVKKLPQVLILVPTREIAVQIEGVIKTVGSSFEDLKTEVFIGGLPVDEDIRKIEDCHIVVGAPGRVKHLISLGAFCTDSIRLLVLDEADKLMEASFQDDITEIYNALPQKKQIVASSATYPDNLDTFLVNYMLSPTHVTSELETPILLGLKQFVYVTSTCSSNVVQLMKAKNENLIQLLSNISFTQCLIFSNYQMRAESISNFLNQKGWNSSFISAAQSQAKRLEAVNNLKNFKSRILLSTDLTSRGIDAPNVDLVINYDIPHDAVTYLHRMGRAGRYGSPGLCINLTVGSELVQLQKILGAIGASNLSIAKLPPLTDFNVWQIDPDTLEKIPSIAPDDIEKTNQEIKNEILSFKQNTSKEEKGKNGKKNKRKNDKNILNSKKEEIYEQFSSASADVLLDSLNSGNILKINEDPVIDTQNDLQLLTVEESAFLKEKKTPEAKRNNTFNKNKALFSATKLLCDHNNKLQVDADVVESIDEYLRIVKDSQSFDDSPLEEFEPVAETLMTDIDVIEDIFKIGYECLITGGKNWIQYLPKEELKNFQKFCRNERQESTSEDSVEEEDDAFEMNVYEEDARQEDEAPNLEWVPVQRDNEGRNNHFTKCYQDCSDALWQNGLTFGAVADFDDWFYSWQEHLQSVRNYVQQNIYVQEMSKHQQNRANKS